MIIPYPQVINKNIIYSDTVIPLNSLGKDIKISSISNVEENDLEKCLDTVIEANEEVTFNTIQYSKNNKEVYFYTDKPINTEIYNETKTYKFRMLTNSKEILQELNNLLQKEKPNNPESISLYDVDKLIRQTKKNKDDLENQYKNKMKAQLDTKEKYYNSSIIIYGFDQKKKELNIGFNKNYRHNYEDIVLAKNYDDDLYIVESTTKDAKLLLPIIGNTLSKLYDDIQMYNGFDSEKKYDIKSTNSNFLVSMSNYGTSFYDNGSEDKYDRDFKISSHNYKDEYDYECNSTALLEVLKGNEQEIFKRIFVNINDCPSWAQEELRNIRKKQLNTEKKEEQKKELKKKIFPWLRNKKI